ncbi:MAG: type II toxin-antitoxin system VapC family toxin [Acidobacteria bacterium]|nr:type II toxin-antitoxin system VapC family toxin [Acidobacteriota bacterium]
MNVVDSSAWLEYFANGPNAGVFAPAVEDLIHLVVPTICLLEVFKRVLQQRDEGAAFQAIALMQQGTVRELDVPLALRAAKLGIKHRLPLADSVVLATARECGAILWTQDADFSGIEGVKFVAKKRG